MTPFLSGFADELVKTANVATRTLERLRRSPELRKAILHSAMLGGATGAAAGVLTHEGKEGRVRKALGGAALGAIGGGITGAAYPAWFGKANRLAHDEIG